MTSQLQCLVSRRLLCGCYMVARLAAYRLKYLTYGYQRQGLQNQLVMQNVPDRHAMHKSLCYHSNGRAVRVNTNLCDPSLQTTHDRVGCSPHFFLHLSYSLENSGLTTFLFIPYANFICFPSSQSYDIICIYGEKKKKTVSLLC